ncbi:hypothetical protein [Corynebacterium xerosis]|uniref:hypothetical protein n=1 Tax=Corynebacterium xerosis TaxID=1725 RepID=UPI0013CECBD1|nr:hypothetical protein [Corynebacterium xerosis]
MTSQIDNPFTKSVATLLTATAIIGEERCHQRAHLGSEIAKWGGATLRKYSDTDKSDFLTTLSNEFETLRDAHPEAAEELLGEIKAVNSSLLRLLNKEHTIEQDENGTLTKIESKNPRTLAEPPIRKTPFPRRQSLTIAKIAFDSIDDLLIKTEKGKVLSTIIKEVFDIFRS